MKEFRDSGYVGAADTSRSLLNWWFLEPHLLPGVGTISGRFQYYFAQREAIETLLKDRPKLAGIASPGMPSGAPGMDGPREPNPIVGFGGGRTVPMGTY